MPYVHHNNSSLPKLIRVAASLPIRPLMNRKLEGEASPLVIFTLLRGGGADLSGNHSFHHHCRARLGWSDRSVAEQLELK